MDYSLEVQRRFHSPDNIGEYPQEAPGIATGEAEDRTLNVWVRIQAQVDGSVIRKLRLDAPMESATKFLRAREISPRRPRAG